MIIIQQIEYSKNPVSISEAFLFYTTLIEVLAIWSDPKIKSWNDIKATSWQNVKLKYF